MTPQTRIAPLAWCEDILMIEQASTSLPWSRSALTSCFDAKNSDAYFNLGLWNCDNDRLLAFLIVNKAVADEWCIMNIVVAPWAQRQGYARQLLEYLCKLAEQQQARIFLEVRESNQAARQLYQKSNFREIARRIDYYPSVDNQRETAVIMEWLSASCYSQ